MIPEGKDTTFRVGLAGTCETGKAYMKTRIGVLRVLSVFSLIAKSENWHGQLQF